MKKFFVNIFATTGISLILLSIIAVFCQAACIYLQTVFQVLGANIVIHFSLNLLNTLEIEHALIEILLHITLIIMMLIAFGSIFHWFTSTPIWVLSIMGSVIYIISTLLNLFYMKHKAQEINALIKKRYSKNKQ